MTSTKKRRFGDLNNSNASVMFITINNFLIINIIMNVDEILLTVITNNIMNIVNVNIISVTMNIIKSDIVKTNIVKTNVVKTNVIKTKVVMINVIRTNFVKVNVVDRKNRKLLRFKNFRIVPNLRQNVERKF